MIKDSQQTAIITWDHEVSYNEMLRRIQYFSQISQATLGQHVLIFGENSEAWIYAFFSAWAQGAIAIPVDAGNTAEDLAYILNDCCPAVVWTSRKCQDTLRVALEQSGVQTLVLVMDEYERAPLNEEQPARIIFKEADTAVIIYTSGTTGSPKGVMLSFGNLLANIAGVSQCVPIYTTQSRTLILLPLHHVLPLQGTLIVPIATGGCVVLCPSLNAPDIMRTLMQGRVSLFIGVPRLWQSIYMGIKKKIDSNVLTRSLFWLCQRIDNIHFSRWVFGAVHKKMGGCIKYMISGGAALDREIGHGLRTLGFTVLEGYGMTETAPIITFTRPDDVIPGCAGTALPNVDIKLVEGELCAKGPNVMLGYYNRPEETAAVIDDQGYIHTGDLARIDDKGHVFIIGRTKEIIVLSNGKNIQPAEIEFKLEKFASFIKEAAVVQQEDKLCAILVPQKEWAKTMSDDELEQQLKEQVLKPYNEETESYKKIMRLFVYHEELPRTKMDKLQRFKLQEIVNQGHSHLKRQPTIEPTYKEYQILKAYIQQEKELEVLPIDHIEMDLGFDSLDKVGLQTFIEQTFGVKMDINYMVSFKNIEELSEYIANSKTKISIEQINWKQTLQQKEQLLQLPTSTFFLPLCTKILKLFFLLYNRLSFVGKENIPKHGPFILAPNHQSYVDGGVVMSGIDWLNITRCYFYATEDHIHSAWRRWLARHSNIVLMERANLKDSIQKLAQILSLKKNIIIFPEGSRTRTGQVAPFKKTFAILSKELGVPIIPVYIQGAYDALPRHKRWLRPKKIEVNYLSAVYPQDYPSAEVLSEEIRRRIIAAAG